MIEQENRILGSTGTRTIGSLLAEARGFETIETFVRIKRDYDMEKNLQLICEIGKQITGKEFRIDNDNRHVYEAIVKWTNGDDSLTSMDVQTGRIITGSLQKGFYIAGNTGTGKSTALDILNVYARMTKAHYIRGGIKKPMLWYNLRAEDLADKYVTEGYDSVKFVKNHNILGIQDLGAEPNEVSYMGNKIELIRNIINSRGDKGNQITHFTSNYKLSRLNERYDSRVVSRINEMVNYYELKGKDRRLTK